MPHNVASQNQKPEIILIRHFLANNVVFSSVQEHKIHVFDFGVVILVYHFFIYQFVQWVSGLGINIREMTFVKC